MSKNTKNEKELTVVAGNKVDWNNVIVELEADAKRYRAMMQEDYHVAKIYGEARALTFEQYKAKRDARYDELSKRK